MATRPKTYQFKILSISGKIEDVETELANLANAGWEITIKVIAVSLTNVTLTGYAKRA